MEVEETTEVDKPTWSQVLSRKERRHQCLAQNAGNTPVPRQQQQQQQKLKLLQKRKPRTEAVVLKKKEESTYPMVLKKAQQQIPPTMMEEVGVEVVKVRYTRSGEMLLELRQKKEGGVGTFAEKLKVAVGEMAEVRKPERTTTILLLDVDPACTEEEVGAACKGKVRSLQQSARGTTMARVDVPIEAAVRMLENGSIRIGWSTCRVRSLETRQQRAQRCYQCLLPGHLAKDCQGASIGKQCYSCSGEGHTAAKCTSAQLRCPVCSKREGQGAGHVLGGRGCLSVESSSSRQGRRGGGASQA